MKNSTRTPSPIWDVYLSVDGQIITRVYGPTTQTAAAQAACAGNRSVTQAELCTVAEARYFARARNAGE